MSTNDNKGAGNVQPRHRYERVMNLLQNSKGHKLWDKKWDIDIKIWRILLGHWYKRNDGVPLQSYCMFVYVFPEICRAKNPETTRYCK